MKQIPVLTASLILFISFCSSVSQAQDNTGLLTKREIVIHEELFVLDQSGDSIFYEIGTIFVPENRKDPAGRTIGVGFLKIHSKVESPISPPVFYLPGGPGYSFIGNFKNQNGKEGGTFSDVIEFAAFSDVVLVDQRGFSKYGDELRHPYNKPAGTLTFTEEIDLFKIWAEEASAEFAKNNIDLSGYTIIELANDVNELRFALDYDSISLYGWSFGSQWSLVIMRLFPEIVVRAMFSGTEGINHDFDMPSEEMAAIHRTWESVDKDERFTPYLPPGGMKEVAQTVVKSLEQKPLLIADNITIGPTEVKWDNPTALLWIYNDDTELYTPYFKNVYSFKSAQKKLLNSLVNSSLGITEEREMKLRADTASRYISQASWAKLIATQDIWPTPDVGDSIRIPVQSDIPVVFVQGDWDFKTPIEYTYEIAPYFTNSHVLIAKQGGHGVFGDIKRQHYDVWIEMKEFLQTGDMNDIATQVTLEPAFSFENPYPNNTNTSIQNNSENKSKE